jgi:hypothetical protein
MITICYRYEVNRIFLIWSNQIENKDLTIRMKKYLENNINDSIIIIQSYTTNYKNFQD